MLLRGSRFVSGRSSVQIRLGAPAFSTIYMRTAPGGEHGVAYRVANDRGFLLAVTHRCDGESTSRPTGAMRADPICPAAIEANLPHTRPTRSPLY